MKKKTILYIVIAICILAAIGTYCYFSGKEKEMLVYSEALGETAVTVDGTVLTMRDMAFYIAYEEATVEEQARIYDDEDTNAYWNLHIDGEFIKVSAKTAAMDMAVHDEIFYRMALSEGVELSEEEVDILRERQADFWADLSDTAKEQIVVSREELNQTMEKIAIAQKYQTIYANLQGGTYEEYEFNGDSYQVMVATHQVEVNTDIWDRLDFGNVTLEH